MEVIRLFYDKHLGDNPEILYELRLAMELGQRTLLKGPTGSGKTVLIGEIARKILADEELTEDEKIYEGVVKLILSCPNVIQNRQNQSNQLVGAKSLTKGESITKDDRFISAVYDKTYIAAHEGDKIHLILDEAHKRVFDETYRATALSQVDECEKMAYSVTHVTATPRVLLHGVFEYDNISYVSQEIRKIITTLRILNSLLCQRLKESLYL